MRTVLLVAHCGREQIARLTGETVELLRAADFEVRMLADEADTCGHPGVEAVSGPDAAQGCELVVTMGGDGTFLRAAELARPAGAAMLGVNLGHVGFLAQADPESLRATLQDVIEHRYEIEERVTVDADVVVGGQVLHRVWALNEVSLERTNRARMLELAVAVDDRPLLRFGCDGLLCATPTGSTAYAFSTGGPIIWPDVDALLVVPNAAHALFARSVVVAPGCTVDVDLISTEHQAVLSCDGRRTYPVPAGARVRMRRGAMSVRVVRLDGVSFTERLVSKFQLPVQSLREASRPAQAPGEPGSQPARR